MTSTLEHQHYELNVKETRIQRFEGFKGRLLKVVLKLISSPKYAGLPSQLAWLEFSSPHFDTGSHIYPYRALHLSQTQKAAFHIFGLRSYPLLISSVSVRQTLAALQPKLCFFSLLNCNTQIRTPTRGLRKPLLPSKTAYARVTFQEVPTRLPPRKLLQRSLYLM